MLGATLVNARLPREAYILARNPSYLWDMNAVKPDAVRNRMTVPATATGWANHYSVEQASSANHFSSARGGVAIGFSGSTKMGNSTGYHAVCMLDGFDGYRCT